MTTHTVKLGSDGKAVIPENTIGPNDTLRIVGPNYKEPKKKEKPPTPYYQRNRF